MIVYLVAAVVMFSIFQILWTTVTQDVSRKGFPSILYRCGNYLSQTMKFSLSPLAIANHFNKISAKSKQK